jgi:hypothetical protein
MSAGRPTAGQLQLAARERRRAARECFDVVVERVFARVAAKARQGWVRVVYEVPEFVVGLPPYDVAACARHAAKELRRRDYHVEVFGAGVLYVSWDPAEAGRRA